MILIFSKGTKRGTGFDRAAGADEFQVNMNRKDVGFFTETPERYWHPGAFAEFPGWQQEQSVAVVQSAINRKTKEIEAKCKELQGANFPWGDHEFYCDKDDRDKNIPLTALASLLLTDDDPIPTDQPYPGCWVSAADEQGVRTPVPFTCAEFKPFAIAVYRRTSSLWGKEKIHLATIAAMAAGGATPEQIAAYDINSGW